jgi:hypothetical protein
MHRVLLFTLAGILAFFAFRGMHRRAVAQEALLARDASSSAQADPAAPLDAASPSGVAGNSFGTPTSESGRPGGASDRGAPLGPGGNSEGTEFIRNPSAFDSLGTQPDLRELAGRGAGTRIGASGPGTPTDGGEGSADDSGLPQAVVEAWGSLHSQEQRSPGEEYWVGRMHLELSPADALGAPGAASSERRRQGLLIGDGDTRLEAIDELYGLGWSGRSRQPWDLRPQVLLPAGRSASAGLRPGEYRLHLWIEGSSEPWEGRLIILPRSLPPPRR